MKGFKFSITVGILGFLIFIINPLLSIFFIIYCVVDTNLQNTSLILKKLDKLGAKKNG